MERIQFFGGITKVREESDGTLYVEGVASTEARDTQGEIVTRAAMKKALPDYMRFPAVREMHQLWAAGRTVGAAVDDEGVTHIAARIVDKEACQKVREKVYNGFSIGGRVDPEGRNKADPTIIESLTLTEISLVDRPANPEAVFQLVKIDAGAPAVEKRGDEVTDSGWKYPGNEKEHRENAEGATESHHHSTASYYHEGEARAAADGGQPAIADAHRAAASAHREAGYARNAKASKRAQEASRVAHDKTDAFRSKAAKGDAMDPKKDPKAAKGHTEPDGDEGKPAPAAGGDETPPGATEQNKAEGPVCKECGGKMTCAKCNKVAAAEIETLRKTATDASEALTKAEAKARDAEEARALAAASLAKVTAERDAVEGRMKRLAAEREAGADDLARIRRERDEAESALSKATAEVATSSDRLSKVTIERDAAEGDARRMRADRDRAEAEFAKARAERDSFEQTATRHKAQAATLDERLGKESTARLAAETEVAKAQATVTSLTEMVAKTARERDAAISDLGRARSERDGAETRIARLTSERNDLEGGLAKVTAERDALATDLAKTKATLAEAQAATAKATAEAAEFKAQRDKVQADLARAPKGALRAVPPVAVDKGTDAGSRTTEEPKAEPETAIDLVKKSHQNPLPFGEKKATK